MDMFEKAEKLKNRANVSFEEAKEALDKCDGDLLDAMVYLEKLGKVKEPGSATYSTSYEQQEKFTSVREKVKSQQQSQSANVFEAIRSFIRGFADKCRGNYVCVKKGEEILFRIPVLALLVLLIAFWKVLLPVMIILLFLGCRYSFYGKSDLKEANEFADRASSFADKVKKEFVKETTASETQKTSGEEAADTGK